MAYACPVCAEPQVDAEHLANHVAFTAIGGDDDHEAWLDEHAPEWGQLGQAELAAVVVEHADETEFPVDVDAPEQAGGHDHDHGPAFSGSRPSSPPGELDEDAQDLLAEARELTRQMREPADSAGDGPDVDEPDGGGAAAGDDASAPTDEDDADDDDRTDSETQ